MRIISLVFITGYLFVATSIHAEQSDIDKLENFYFKDRLDELETLLVDVEKTNPDHPTVLYLKGLFEKDASKAIEYYKNVYNHHKNSVFADEAIFRIAQYYYSISDYVNARKFLSIFLKEFNNSPLKDRIQYLFCQTVYAQGKEDSARIFLQAFIKNVRNSPFVNLAVIDLESPAMWNQSNLSREKMTDPVSRSKYRYSIQIGAFTVEKNAKSVKEKFEKDSHYVEIKEKNINNRIFYAVWIGRFDNREGAMIYANTYIEKYNIDYKIVKR